MPARACSSPATVRAARRPRSRGGPRRVAARLSLAEASSTGARRHDRRRLPYRAELDQSGALLRALGAGVPAVVYDVGGLGEPVASFGAGRVVPPDDVAGLADAVRELLDDRVALDEARAGALRAREELSWDASARAHLELYRELA